jgi:hypothetical protein
MNLRVYFLRIHIAMFYFNPYISTTLGASSMNKSASYRRFCKTLELKNSPELIEECKSVHSNDSFTFLEIQYTGIRLD